MKRLPLFLLCCLFYSACQGDHVGQGGRNPINFDDNWRFILADDSTFKNQNLNDSDWRTLTLPHDWSIEGKFAEENPATPGGGALPGGVGWYRKHFSTEKNWKNKKVYIRFDGIYRNSEVYINGHLLGKRPSGYSSLEYDLTPWLNSRGENNILAVRADNSQQPNSRWYSGSGIYRNTSLIVTDPVHVVRDGVFIHTKESSHANASLEAQVTVTNTGDNEDSIRIFSRLISPQGRVVAQDNNTVYLAAKDTCTVQHYFNIDEPQLWSPKEPVLYNLQTEIYLKNRLLDTYVTRTGIRNFEFTTDSGLILNGKVVKIKGVCNHHDLGALGAAFNKRAAQRQLELLKEMGCNAIRTAHNAPAPQLLDLCDEMGFIVMDETFDMWRKRKSPYDYSLYFDDWFEQDLTEQIIRDRNHPSVFIWSIGNEVLEQWDNASNDTLDLQTANMLINFQSELQKSDPSTKGLSLNARLTRKLTDVVRSLDPTRPITAGNNETGKGNHVLNANCLDLIGVNYHLDDWDSLIERFPEQPLIATETTSALMSRGFYEFPASTPIIRPNDWRILYKTDHSSCSSFDNCHVPWGTTHEKSWIRVRDDDRISGLFVWTGFDYLGEPTPYWWPARSSYFGIIDLAGIPKDVYYMYQSEWSDTPVLHVFPHWNWNKGDLIDIWAYYNNADEVELYLNGVSQGIRHKSDDTLHASWNIPFENGELTAVSRLKGKEVLKRVVRTADAPYTVRLTPDRDTLVADGKDLSYILVEVIDKNGTLVPDSEHLLQFTVEGAGMIEGADNGSPIAHESLRDNRQQAAYGKCMVIVRSGKESGNCLLKCTGEGLLEQEISLTMEDKHRGGKTEYPVIK